MSKFKAIALFGTPVIRDALAVAVKKISVVGTAVPNYFRGCILEFTGPNAASKKLQKYELIHYETASTAKSLSEQKEKFFSSVKSFKNEWTHKRPVGSEKMN